jgi:DNA repair photolyase
MLVTLSQTHIHPALREYIEYRKSGLSVNHVVGCPLNCAYCVRHFWDNFEQKEPQLLASDEQAFSRLLAHECFIPHKTPIQLFNRATDPFLPAVKPHTFRFAALMDEHKLTNHLLVITRYRVSQSDVVFLESLTNVKITLLFTYSGMNGSSIEPIPESIPTDSIKVASEYKSRIKTILYWRPIVPGWNDSEETLAKVLRVARFADAIVFTGLFFRKQQDAFFRRNGIGVPYQEFHRRKVLPSELESRVLAAYQKSGIGVPIFRKTSCAVSHIHGYSDYNGHYGVPELCDICPKDQLGLCARCHLKPTDSEFQELLSRYGYATAYEISDGHITTSDLSEEERYHVQHSLGFQIWDREYPHIFGKHGRASI